MGNETYVKTEVVGVSSISVSDAIASAIATASRSLRNLEWFEVVSVRGKISENKVVNYQVTLKLGLLYEPKTEQYDSDRPDGAELPSVPDDRA
jgi:flavin-binding protein dodecin